MNIYIIIILFIVLYIKINKKNKILFKKLKPKLPNYLYKLFYTDEKLGKRYKNVIYSKILYSKKYNIKGKPDYIYKHKIKNILLPVELKSSIIGNSINPKKNDLMQLCTYFLIIEDIYKKKPKKGYLIYKDAMFVVKNNKYLKKETLNILNEMRNMLIKCDKKANNSISNCKNCICKNTVCKHCNN